MKILKSNNYNYENPFEYDSSLLDDLNPFYNEQLEPNGNQNLIVVEDFDRGFAGSIINLFEIKKSYLKKIKI